MTKLKWILILVFLVVGIPMTLYGWHLETTIGTTKETIMIFIPGILMIIGAAALVWQTIRDKIFNK